MMNATRHASRLRQQGIAGVLGVMFLIAAVIFVLSQTLGITGSGSMDSQRQMDSVGAFFLAESGLEQAQGILYSASDPAIPTVCTGITTTGSNIAVGRGKFTVSGVSSGCALVGSVMKCSGCTLTSTGSIPATGTVTSSRTVVRVISLQSPSGGAYGCGGGGAASVDCPTGYPAADWYPYIVQNVNVQTAPAILMSNLAYPRHPQGKTNTVNAASLVTVLDSSGAQVYGGATQWTDESAHSSDSNVIGSRGASALVTTAGTYTLSQSLTADSLFAAVGARIDGSGLTIRGSYWNDINSSGSGTVSTVGSSGQTNNGAACNPSTSLCTAATPPPATIPSGGSQQTSNSWCYDADTLVFGFSGNSVNNATGVFSSFSFNGSPPSTLVTNGTATYPSTHTNKPQVFSTLSYITNPAYVSAGGASSGEVTGAIGATFNGYIEPITTTTVTVTATATNGSATLTSITDILNGPLQMGDVFSSSTCTSGNDPKFAAYGGNPNVTVQSVTTTPKTATVDRAAQKTCTANFTFTRGPAGNPLTVTSVTPGSGLIEIGSTISGGTIPSNTTVVAQTLPYTGGVGTYTLSNTSLTQGSLATPITMTTTSNTLTVSGVTNGNLYVGDTLSGVASGTTIASCVSASCTFGYNNGGGGTGTYTLSGSPQNVAPGTAIKTQTITLLSEGATPSVPGAQTFVAVRAATGGKFVAGTKVTGTPISNAPQVQFKVSSPPTTSLNGAVPVCGGICAFFNHDTSVNSGMTPFTVSISNTYEWAAGMTCLKGVSSLTGLTGRSSTTTPTRWYESVQ